MDAAGRRRRQEAIDGLAQHLCAMRTAAGTPSFRAMAARSGAISHTTLHEAVAGHRLPTWETTVEFVRALGADPGPVEPLWARARATLDQPDHRPPRPRPADERPAHPAAPGSTPPDAGGGASDPGDPVLPTDPEAPTTPDARDPGHDPATAPRRPRASARRWAATSAAAVAVLLVAVGATVWRGADSGERASATDAVPLLPQEHGRADCPVQQPAAPDAPPRHEGDLAVFVGDATLPDCSVVDAGSRVEKTWRLRNAGTRPWVGYHLTRLDPGGAGTCQTISAVPVAATRPGATVDVSTTVTVPAGDDFCMVRFKLTDAAGEVAFPGARPVTFQLVIEGDAA
ncbi:hypothetical protein KC207_14315 [Phycicoccus sp. BSK3Z-2]|uniref:Nbr1 FW domain-containing protein n=1 Tax=Phycicoccus avicenniae TaxID=2828860 RepID=A0A941DAC9_9MICO|nr:NBR1-Ig-like domain-containing protein [Phycicoccus avicenniae]MBR7744466.1 hypothetical protein [Phycicoccus avicenniae]